jgi:cytochrome P450
LLALTTPVEHAARRKIWDHAFTPSALKGYEPLMFARVAELVETLATRCGAPVDLAEWLSLFTVDFMGDFAYGGAFNTMKAGADTQGVRRAGEDALSMVETLGTVAWVRPLMLALPRIGRKKIRAAALAVTEQRKAKSASARDLFYYLVCFHQLLSTQMAADNGELHSWTRMERAGTHQ